MSGQKAPIMSTVYKKGDHLTSCVKVLCLFTPHACTCKCPLCCGVVKIIHKNHVYMHGMSSAAIIGYNYVRYDAETSPDH